MIGYWWPFVREFIRIEPFLSLLTWEQMCFLRRKQLISRTKNSWRVIYISVSKGPVQKAKNMTTVLIPLSRVFRNYFPWPCCTLRISGWTMPGDCWRDTNLNWHVSMVLFSLTGLIVDDIQGTGCVTQAAIKAAVWVAKGKVADQKIVIFGAGTAGTGISLGNSR